MATTFKKVSNNGQSSLYADITTTGQTTITITPSHTNRFPSSGSFWIRVYNSTDPSTATTSELMLVTSVATNVFTVTRNADSAGSSTFSTGHAVRLNVMANHLNDITTAVNTVEDKLDGTSTGVVLNTPTLRNFDGWFDANETWTYASATTFTVSGDKTSKYQIGDRIKLTQSSTTKYFFVVSASYSAPNTTVTVTGGSDYSLANSSITANYYARGQAFGFPAAFNHSSPTYTANASMTFTSVTTNYSYFTIVNRVVYWWFRCTGTTGGTASTYFSASLPIQNSARQALDVCPAYDTALTPDGATWNINPSATAVDFIRNGGNWGLGASRGVQTLIVFTA